MVKTESQDVTVGEFKLPDFEASLRNSIGGIES
jgi:hypothetical protein